MNKKEEAFYYMFAVARKQYEAENADPIIRAIKDGDELWDDFIIEFADWHAVTALTFA